MATPRRRRTPLRIIAAAAAAVVIAALAAAVPAQASPAASPQLAGDPAALVNPLIGTSGYVDTFPGADMPFGMVQWSPDTTPDRPAGGGYEYTDSQISGFSLSHISGPGCGVAGDIPILPLVGDPGANPGSAKSPFSHTGEVAQAGYYAVTTGTGATAVKTELSTTTRAGIGRFTFPAIRPVEIGRQAERQRHHRRRHQRDRRGQQGADRLRHHRPLLRAEQPVRERLHPQLRHQVQPALHRCAVRHVEQRRPGR